MEGKLFPFSEGFLANCHPSTFDIFWVNDVPAFPRLGERFTLPFLFNQLEVLSFWGNRRETAVCKSWMYILLLIKQLQPRTPNTSPFSIYKNTSTQNGGKSPASHSLVFAGGYLGSRRTKLKSISVPSRRSRNGRKGGDFLSIKTPLSNWMFEASWHQINIQKPTSQLSQVGSIVYPSWPYSWKWKRGPSNSIVSIHLGLVFHFHDYGRKGNPPNKNSKNQGLCSPLNLLRYIHTWFQRSPPDRSMLPRSEWKWLDYPPWNEQQKPLKMGRNP